jgi:hypothetical protein
MATSRTQQSHAKRVDQIAEEAAAKIAADSPLEEDVVVTIEEIPPTATREAHRAVAKVAGPLVDSPVAPTRYVETLATVGAANVEWVRGMFDAQLRFARGLTEAISPRTR